MDQWQKLLFDLVEDVAKEVEHFFFEVAEVVDICTEVAEEVAEQTYKAIAGELERSFPALSWTELWDFEETEDASYEFYGVEPMLRQPPACVGCCHFHGQVYGGTAFVCGMYPYGPDATQCPDWEANSGSL
jgi:hypothetical protein